MRIDPDTTIRVTLIRETLWGRLKRRLRGDKRRIAYTNPRPIEFTLTQPQTLTHFTVTLPDGSIEVFPISHVRPVTTPTLQSTTIRLTAEDPL